MAMTLTEAIDTLKKFAESHRGTYGTTCHAINVVLASVEAKDKTLAETQARWAQAEGERVRLEGLINTPRTDEFFEAARLEAAHQIERWGADHDTGKFDTDWFWLLGHLAGKAVRGDEKRLHHIITSAALCLNWWRHATGASTKMRPGIDGAA